MVYKLYILQIYIYIYNLLQRSHLCRMALSNRDHDFYFVDFLLIQNWFCGMMCVMFNFSLLQTFLAFLILILAYYCLYLELHVGVDPLSRQSALSGSGSHLFSPPWEILFVNFPFSLSSYPPFPLMQAYPIVNNQEMTLKFFFACIPSFLCRLFLLFLTNLISEMFLHLKPNAIFNLMQFFLSSLNLFQWLQLLLICYQFSNL